MAAGPEADPAGALPGRLPWWLSVSVLAATGLAVLLFAWVSLGRTLWYSPDSFFYADVAMNVAAGRGLVQSVSVTFGRVEMEGLYTPLREWAPGYPLLIAALVLLGVPAGYAALAIASAALGVTLAAVWLLLRRSFDEGVAAVALGLVLLYLPVIFVFRHAWSEALSMAFFFAGMACLLLRPRDARTILLGALLTAAACATRYAYLPALLLGPALLLAEWGRGRETRARFAWLLSSWALGSAAIVLPLVVTNLQRTGHWFGAPRNASTIDLATHLSDAWLVLTAGYVPREWLSAAVQAKILLVTVLIVLLVAVLRRRVVPLLKELIAGKGWVLAAWAVVYLAFMIIVSSRVEIDRLGPRLLIPGLLPVVLLFAVFLVRGLGLRLAQCGWLAMALLAGVIAWQGYLLLALPAESLAGRVDASARLQWIANQTRPDDLIIGDSAFDIPLYCGPRHVWCYVPLPDPAYHLEEADIVRYLDENKGAFSKAYLVLRKAAPIDPWAEAQWRQYYGDYFTDLVYSGSGLILDDAFVFDLTGQVSPQLPNGSDGH